jgi:hypothetical protein
MIPVIFPTLVEPFSVPLPEVVVYFITLFLIKRRPFLFEINITDSNGGRFYSKSEVISHRNGLNSTFPNK